MAYITVISGSPGTGKTTLYETPEERDYLHSAGQTFGQGTRGGRA